MPSAWGWGMTRHPKLGAVERRAAQVSFLQDLASSVSFFQQNPDRLVVEIGHHRIAFGRIDGTSVLFSLSPTQLFCSGIESSADSALTATEPQTRATVLTSKEGCGPQGQNPHERLPNLTFEHHFSKGGMMSSHDSFAASGNSPTRKKKTAIPQADFRVEYHGSICLLVPLSAPGREWVEERIRQLNRSHRNSFGVTSRRKSEGSRDAR